MIWSDNAGVLLIYLFIRILFGLGAMAIASSKGRSMVGWFFAGFFLAIIGIIIVACLSNLKEEEARRQMTEMEHRRLREQLRQEQMKTESYRRYTVARLDAHDQALGLDTRAQPQLLIGGDMSPLRAQLPAGPGAASGLPTAIPPVQQAPVQYPAVSQPAPAEPPSDGMQWYYERQGQTIGPVGAQVISGLLTSGRIAPATLVWCQDFTEWTPANRTVAFAEAAGA